jgi:hypothetical protein
MAWLSIGNELNLREKSKMRLRVAAVLKYFFARVRKSDFSGEAP